MVGLLAISLIKWFDLMRVPQMNVLDSGNMAGPLEVSMLGIKAQRNAVKDGRYFLLLAIGAILRRLSSYRGQ